MSLFSLKASFILLVAYILWNVDHNQNSNNKSPKVLSILPLGETKTVLTHERKE